MSLFADISWQLDGVEGQAKIDCASGITALVGQSGAVKGRACTGQRRLRSLQDCSRAATIGLLRDRGLCVPER